jgi:hypothetical protein
MLFMLTMILIIEVIRATAYPKEMELRATYDDVGET